MMFEYFLDVKTTHSVFGRYVGHYFWDCFFWVAPFVKHFFLFGRCILCLNGQVMGK